MAEVFALPARGEWLADVRGGGRAMRVTWHHDAGLVVLSLWQSEEHPHCVGTFRLDAAAVPLLVQALVNGLVEQASHGGQQST